MPPIALQRGYIPSLLASCIHLHMAYYHPNHSLSLPFEAYLASDLGSLAPRLDGVNSESWSAINEEGKIVGTIFVDGGGVDAESSNQNANPEDVKDKGLEERPKGVQDTRIQGEQIPKTTLRFFIVDPSSHGQGIGRMLLNAAISFIDQMDGNGRECELWTFEGLNVAKGMYERVGFRLRLEERMTRWGIERTVQCWGRDVGGKVKGEN